MADSLKSNLTRRTFLKGAGVATAAAVGLTIIVRSARAKSDTLKIGQWTHFVPWVAPISLGTSGWKWMLDSLYSPVNWVLQALHIVGKDTWPMWFGERDLAMASVIAVHVWPLLPFTTVIIHLDPARGQRGRRSRRRRLLVARDPHRPAAPAADPHRGRPRPGDAGALEPRVLHRHPRRRPRRRRGDLAVPVPGAGGRRGRHAARSPVAPR